MKNYLLKDLTNYILQVWEQFQSYFETRKILLNKRLCEEFMAFCKTEQHPYQKKITTKTEGITEF